MICGEGRAVIAATPRQCIEFVLDLDRYRRADTKIGRVRSVERVGEHQFRATFSARFRGITTPAVTQLITVTPWSAIDVVNAPGWTDKLSRFEGSFRCEPVEGGTHVVHRECLEFALPVRRVAEALLGPWLAADTDAEIGRMKALLEAR
jgi:hypothetical protein